MRILPSLLLAFLVNGCATAYQPQGLGGGFSDTQLAPDVFRVIFRGNGYTAADRAQDFALLRAADLCKQHGFAYFAIINENESVVEQQVNTPGYSQTSGNVYVNGNVATYNGTTTYMPGQTYRFFKPQSGLLFRGFTTKPSGFFSFDTAFLQLSIRQKYNIKPTT
jgi:hypothetical protein